MRGNRLTWFCPFLLKTVLKATFLIQEKKIQCFCFINIKPKQLCKRKTNLNANLQHFRFVILELLKRGDLTFLSLKNTKTCFVQKQKIDKDKLEIQKFTHIVLKNWVLSAANIANTIVLKICKLSLQLISSPICS